MPFSPGAPYQVTVGVNSGVRVVPQNTFPESTSIDPFGYAAGTRFPPNDPRRNVWIGMSAHPPWSTTTEFMKSRKPDLDRFQPTVNLGLGLRSLRLHPRRLLLALRLEPHTEETTK